jgi:hypothetical protein
LGEVEQFTTEDAEDAEGREKEGSRAISNLRRLIEKSMKAPKGRHVIAQGNALGGHAYVALSGLNEITQRRFLWRCHRLLHCAPSGLSENVQTTS